MEDAHYCNDKSALYAVFDGHAGDTTANWSAKNFDQVFEENLRKYRSRMKPKEILAKTFQDVDLQISKIATANPSSGATAAVAFVETTIDGHDSSGPTAIVSQNKSQDKNPQKGNTDYKSTDIEENGKLVSNLYTANVGDTRIVLSCDGRAVRLTQDHTTRVPVERERVERSGGYIAHDRVCGVLAVTRALGDTELKQVITSMPYTTRTRLRPEMDEFIILACDGVWDVMSDQEAVELVREVACVEPSAAARRLVAEAMERRTTDNLTCIVVSLCGPSTRAAGMLDAAQILEYEEQSRRRNRALSIQCFAKTPLN